MNNLAQATSICTSRKGVIKKVSESKKNILVMYKGSAWESGYNIVWVSNFIGEDAAIEQEVALPKKFSTIQVTDSNEKSPTFGDPIVTKEGQPVMKFNSLIEE